MNEQIRNPRPHSASTAGVTLVELLVALSIGSFLIIGAIQVAAQSRHAFRINESIARVQETAQFAMDTLESDIRMASNWGMLSRGDAIVGRVLSKEGYADAEDNADPLDLLTADAKSCGADWALDLLRPIEGSNNDFTLPCPVNGGEQANSDTITIRRAAIEPTEAGALDEDRLYIQSTRTQGKIFNDATVPAVFDPTTSETHRLLVNTYYVAQSSELIPNVPTLRRKTLSANGTIVDQEVAPGVENMQVQFGIDTTDDNTVDRYVNPGNVILDESGTRVMTARIWLVVRSVEREAGIVDDRDYEPGDVDLGPPPADDRYRRLQVSKTILLRNART